MNAKKTNKQILVAMVESVEVGERFTDWPRHLTLAPWFTVASQEGLAEGLEGVGEKFSPMTLYLGERALFGPNNDVGVTLIRGNPLLNTLHKRLVSAVDQSGGVFEDASRQWIGSAYRPHITGPEGELTDPILINGFALVEKVSGQEKGVVTAYELSA